MGQYQLQVPAPDDLLAAVHPIKWQVAVDFGTSYSWFAIAIKDFVSTLNQDAAATNLLSVLHLQLANYIKFNVSWPTGHAPYLKTCKALLYDVKGEVVEGGNEARGQCLSMDLDAQVEYIYIDYLRRLLSVKLVHKNMAMERIKKLGKALVDVIADYLCALVEFLGKFIKHSDMTIKFITSAA
ncbi:hypothetical protein GGF31_003798 [Allomyces arbusculus]|nr:hypothetical protein GGF31_003798 [Allomyces arbusculus]